MTTNTTDCDFCGQEFSTAERHVVTQRRPSDPTDLVSTMWACPDCGAKNNLPSVQQVWTDFENGEYKGILFLSI